MAGEQSGFDQMTAVRWSIARSTLTDTVLEMASRWARFAQWWAATPSSPRGVGPGGQAHATSAHLWWQRIPNEPWREASVTFEVLTEPSGPHLYFWALQASFLDSEGRSHGAAHTGFQWNQSHRDNRAVNWGGYGATADVTSVLDGTRSSLAGIANDENTRSFAWRARTPYRFTIDRGEQGWRSSVTDLVTGERTVIRELFAGGDRLGGLVVWMEIFAPCDASPSAVRWSDLEVRDRSRGASHRVTTVRTNFPDAGRDCLNNDSRLDGLGVVQLTNDQRTAASGQDLSW
jgi:hypothetical protein